MAQAVAMDRSTLARNLKPLERQGLIRIGPGKDLRERIVSLTKLGIKKWMEASLFWEKAQTQVKNTMGQDDLNVLFASLSQLVSLTRKT